MGKWKKCKFFQKELIHLGHLISLQGIKPDPEKVQGIDNMKFLADKKQVRTFLGMTGFYRTFIQNYAAKAKPLTNLLRKDTKFSITDECIKAMEILKRDLKDRPMLTYPNFEKSFIMRTDASGYGIGSTLVQMDDEDIERVISFNSRTLRNYEVNYPVGAKEALAIIFGAKKNFQYLYGNPNVTIETDHKALQYISNWKDSNSTVARWWLKLQDILEFAKVRYIKGSTNVVADALSRIFLFQPTITKEIIKLKQSEDN